MLSKLNDLLFLIGLFLILIGSVVMAAYLFGADNADLVQNIHVNRLGGGMLMLVGFVMWLLSYVNDRKLAAASKK